MRHRIYRLQGDDPRPAGGEQDRDAALLAIVAQGPGEYLIVDGRSAESYRYRVTDDGRAWSPESGIFLSVSR